MHFPGTRLDRRLMNSSFLYGGGKARNGAGGSAGGCCETKGNAATSGGDWELHTTTSPGGSSPGTRWILISTGKMSQAPEKRRGDQGIFFFLLTTFYFPTLDEKHFHTHWQSDNSIRQVEAKVAKTGGFLQGPARRSAVSDLVCAISFSESSQKKNALIFDFWACVSRLLFARGSARNGLSSSSDGKMVSVRGGPSGR